MPHSFPSYGFRVVKPAEVSIFFKAFFFSPGYTGPDHGSNFLSIE